jgi:hypothetical protein
MRASIGMLFICAAQPWNSDCGIGEPWPCARACLGAKVAQLAIAAAMITLPLNLQLVEPTTPIRPLFLPISTFFPPSLLGVTSRPQPHTETRRPYVENDRFVNVATFDLASRPDQSSSSHCEILNDEATSSAAS